jgi:hypothetical protein
MDCGKGAQAIEDSLRIVRNYTGKNLMFATGSSPTAFSLKG